MTERRDAMAGAEVGAAYEHCRAVAKREAKNFYYAFLALPQAKSSAMCAMYAFMRRADDIADDEAMAVEERRALMQQWREAFAAGKPTSDEDRAVFLAVRDTQQRFQIPDILLEDLVAGTAMDLQAEPPAGVDRLEMNGRSYDVYRSLEALDNYCYLVASVVGLVTVRIFGTNGKQVDDQAIAMGKAFQYTNILRDVREDAERGRIYLPLELLAQHGASLQDVLHAAEGGAASASLLAAMQAFAARAENFYRVERSLIADLEPDSRGAMRTLVDIYHALLRRIEVVRFRVFEERVRVSTARKVGLLLRGMLLRSHA